MIMAITLAITVMAGVRAQDTVQTGYRSFFGSESTEWHVGEEFFDAWSYHNRKYRMERDTVISGIVYKVIDGYDVYDNEGSFEEYYDIYCDGLFREDTNTGRLWIRSSATNGEDRLIMDMSLDVGDTFVYQTSRIGYVEMVVDEVYTDSVGRKVIVFDGGYDGVYFIEGIGSSDVLGDAIGSDIYCFRQHLMCVFHNDTATYKNHLLSPVMVDHDNCWGRTRAGFGRIKHDGVNIYPNPCKDMAMVKAEEVCMITLYDNVGRALETYSGKEAFFDMRSKCPGVYIIKISQPFGTESKVIVKK